MWVGVGHRYTPTTQTAFLIAQEAKLFLATCIKGQDISNEKLTPKNIIVIILVSTHPPTHCTNRQTDIYLRVHCVHRSVKTLAVLQHHIFIFSRVFIYGCHVQDFERKKGGGGGGANNRDYMRHCHLILIANDGHAATKVEHYFYNDREIREIL